MVGFGQTERDAHRAVENFRDELFFLLLGAEVAEHQHGRKIANDRAFVLQIVVQPEPLRGEVLADDRHRKVGAILAAVFFRQRVAIVPRLVGAPAHLGQQRLPFVAWQAAIFEIGARPFAAMVEETDVVILALERLDLFFDESVELFEIMLISLGIVKSTAFLLSRWACKRTRGIMSRSCAIPSNIYSFPSTRFAPLVRLPSPPPLRPSSTIISHFPPTTLRSAS